ncbi:MAG: YfhO family protein [Isosphaeraceae bacterium]
MHQRLPIVLVLACFAGLFFACYHKVLFDNEQFGFRDAAHYYYPLYQRVQQEWNAGRIPLWETEENAGMTLVGNPTAAVFYPLKVIYAALPYPWAARVYILAHTIIAFAAMLILLRSWGTSWTGSGLAALAYAYGVPILFQSANVIYLVGAAWLPLGMRAVDRWVRLGRRSSVVELTIVLALQLTGGEPQSGYLLGLAGLGYTAGLAWARARKRRLEELAAREIEASRQPCWGWRRWLTVAVGFGIWFLGTIALGCVTPRFRVHKIPSEALPWMKAFQLAVPAAWGLAGLGFLAYWLHGPIERRRSLRPLGLAWAGLAIAAALCGLVTAIQLLPVMEFTQQTLRAAESSPHDIYPFSIEPVKLAGVIWPDVLGVNMGHDAYWGDLLQMPGGPAEVWVPSLYIGVLTILLAAGAFALRRGAPWCIWLSVIAVVSLVASLGQYTSPIWLTRALAAGTKWPPLLNLIRYLGPLDPLTTAAIRHDWFLRDGDGSFYWWLGSFLPGFRQFRYPAKLFTFTALALSALAGIGWDSLRTPASRRRVNRLLVGLAGLTAILFIGVAVGWGAILSRFRAADSVSIYGPFNPMGGLLALHFSLGHALAVLVVGLLAVRLANSRPRIASLLILLAATADLGVANTKYVVTIPQSTFETSPEILSVIQEAERKDPSDGPFRVHRLPAWQPPIWTEATSNDRSREIVAWERDTLQPKYGIPYGLEYAHVMGVAELYEYEWFYGGFNWKVGDPLLAKRVLGINLGEEVVYFPRRTFDMWNVRYFIVPSWPHGWSDMFRGYAAMILDSRPIYPVRGHKRGPEAEKANRDWVEHHDVQVYRNLNEHPRAWVVHSLRRMPPVTELRPGHERQVAMQEMLFCNDRIWNNPTRNVFDFHNIAWVDAEDYETLLGRTSGAPSRTSEAVKVRYPNPQRVELDVNLQTPGLVVLADIYYPGWKLTIDGKPAPIYRTNRIMRGAAVPNGPHHLVYSYDPPSFRIGAIVSAAGLLVLLALGAASLRWPIEPSLAIHAEPYHDAKEKE